jgi:hypothetical protein
MRTEGDASGSENQKTQAIYPPSPQQQQFTGNYLHIVEGKGKVCRPWGSLFQTAVSEGRNLVAALCMVRVSSTAARGSGMVERPGTEATSPVVTKAQPRRP